MPHFTALSRDACDAPGHSWQIHRAPTNVGFCSRGRTGSKLEERDRCCLRLESFYEGRCTHLHRYTPIHRVLSLCSSVLQAWAAWLLFFPFLKLTAAAAQCSVCWSAQTVKSSHFSTSCEADGITSQGPRHRPVSHGRAPSHATLMQCTQFALPCSWLPCAGLGCHGRPGSFCMQCCFR